MTKVNQIIEQISARITSGVYRAGQSLPSIRRGAVQFEVSKNTMAHAYDRLVSRGLLVARRGSGYFVNRHASITCSHPQPEVSEATSVVSLLREQVDQHYETRPGDGRLPPSWTQDLNIRRVLRPEHSTTGRVKFGYGNSWGLGALVNWLRLSLAKRAIPTEPNGIVLTNGVNHGLDLIIRHLLEPGDTVFVDDPGYYPLFAKLRIAKATIIPIRRGTDGPCIRDVESKLVQHRPKAFFTQSHAHNPTGSSLSPSTAFRLLRLAELHDFLLIEDDVFADILEPGLPRLASLNQQRVLYVSSFSKTMSASLRCGYIAGPPALIRVLVDLKMITTVTTSAHVEGVVIDLIDSGQYLRHLRRIGNRLAESTKITVQALSELGLDVPLPEVPGFYLWVALPSHLDEHDLCRQAAQAGIFIAPASAFYVNRDSTRKPGMRVNVAYGMDPHFLAFLRERLG